MTKYIQLFEDYDHNTGNLNHSHSWSDLRNQMQNKLPFIIIDFEDEESYQRFKDSQLQGKDYADQTYTIRVEDNPVVMNSVFVFNNTESTEEAALEYIRHYNIHRIIAGEKGKEFPTLYTNGGSSGFGNDLLVSLDPEELGNDDYYKIGSQLYKFIVT